MTKKARLIPINHWAVFTAPSHLHLAHPHRRALQLALEGRIAGAVHFGVEPRKAATRVPTPSRGGFKGIWMVPADAKWPGRKAYQANRRPHAEKRQSVKKIKNLQGDVENA